MAKNTGYDHGLGTVKEQSPSGKNNEVKLNLTFKSLSPENGEDYQLSDFS